AATGFEQFRAPFAAWLPGPVHRRAYGEDPGPLPPDTACVIVEPVQGRAGSRVPPPGFIESLRTRCDDAGALLVVDAIYAGLGRGLAAGGRFERGGWHGRGLLRARRGSAGEALERGVLVVPAGLDGSLVQAPPPLTISDEEVDEALARLG